MANTKRYVLDEKGLLDSVREESVVKLLQKVIQTESTNPPGNELELAKLLADYFASAGLEPQLLEYEKKRANLITQCHGCFRPSQQPYMREGSMVEGRLT